jgi:UDP-N-acetylglucosamine 2-epimerase
MRRPGSVCVVIGTRPEAIKLSPVILELERSRSFQVDVCVTGQHETMLSDAMGAFGVRAGTNLEAMKPDQTLADLSARLLEGLGRHLTRSRPDVVVVQGDTTTALCGALAGFYEGIPVAHVEAGLRTGDRSAPFPEELNRKMITQIADIHFAATDWARQNLLHEHVPPPSIHVTGNTGIDALNLVLKKAKPLHGERRSRKAPAEAGLGPGCTDAFSSDGRKRRTVLVTGHRRESFGDGFVEICAALDCLAREFPDVEFVYPVHLNPAVREPVFRILSKAPNVMLLDPLPYGAFVELLSRSTIVLTDSGGVQEEAPALGKPVLIMREKTERPEGIIAGTARLVGTERERIVREVSTLLTDPQAYRRMARAGSPYGDGTASRRIVRVLRARLGAVNRRETRPVG